MTNIRWRSREKEIRTFFLTNLRGLVKWEPFSNLKIFKIGLNHDLVNQIARIGVSDLLAPKYLPWQCAHVTFRKCMTIWVQMHIDYYIRSRKNTFSQHCCEMFLLQMYGTDSGKVLQSPVLLNGGLATFLTITKVTTCSFVSFYDTEIGYLLK